MPAVEAPENVQRANAIFNAPQHERLALIESLDAKTAAAILPLLLNIIEIPDDARILRRNDTQALPIVGCAEALLKEPARYGAYVRRLRITDPLTFSSADKPIPTLLHFEDGTQDDDEARSSSGLANISSVSPLPAAKVQELLANCPHMESFEWYSSTPPPDGLCEVLGVNNTKISTCLFTPPAKLLQQGPTTKQSLPRWDAPSLLHLSTLPLTTLHVHRLSQSGAKSLVALLEKMAEYSNLEDVWLDFLWLDDALCEALVGAGRRLRRLKLTTSGTKLTDKGIVAILEGCDNLEELSLVEVQGRLSRTLWSKVPDLPLSMTSLNIIVSEAGPHHSWTVDHLTSLPSFSLDVMQSLVVSRTNLPFNSDVEEIASIQPVPRELLDRLKEESVLPTQLNLDWWGWDPSDLKELLASNHQLEELSITFDAPFSKLLTLTSTFANMQNLRTFRVRVPERHAPGVPVQQYHLHVSQSPVKHLSGLPTPAASPVASSRGMARSPSSPADKPSSLPTGQPSEPPFQTPPATPSDTFSTLSLGITPMSPPTSGAGCEPISQASHSVNSAFGISRNSSSNDASFPNPRDIQKFARRCPKLETLDWYGRNGRGSWTITREGSSAFTNGGALNGALSASTTFTPASEGNATAHSVNTVTVKAEHVPPYFPSPSDQLQAARESEAETWGWESTIEREGAEWTGPAAEVWAAEQAEKEALAAEEKERERLAIAAAAAEAQAQAAAEKAKEKEGRQRAASVSNEGAKRKGKGSNKLPKLDTSGNGSTGAGEGSNASSNSRRRSSYAGAINSPTKALSSSTPIKSSESGKTIRRPSTNSTSPSTTNGSGTSSNWRSSGRKRAGSVGVNGSVNGGGLKLDVGVPSAAGNVRSPTNTSPTKAAVGGSGSANRTLNGPKSASRPSASAGGRKTSSRSS